MLFEFVCSFFTEAANESKEYGKTFLLVYEKKKIKYKRLMRSSRARIQFNNKRALSHTAKAGGEETIVI